MQKTQLQSQILKNPTLKYQFHKAQQKYNKQIQLALYSDLREVETIIPESPIKDDHNNPILLFLETSKVFTQSLNQKLYLLLIKSFDNLLSQYHKDKKISIITINSTNKGDSYNKLIRVIKHLPLRFIQNIKQIVVLKGEPIDNVHIHQDQNNPLNKFIRQISFQIQNIHRLDFFGLWSVFDFIVSTSKTSNIYYNNDQKTVQNQRQNYFKAADLKSSLSFDLNELMGDNKIPVHHDQIESYELTDFYVPKVLVLLTCLLQQNPQNLKLEGLFRKSVNIDDEREGLKSIDAQNYIDIENITNPHLAANLIKKFFYRLDIPLFPFSLYDVIVDEDFKGQGGLYLQAAAINKISLTNYMTLKYLIWFFKQCVLPFEHHNRMNISNLSIVFAPTLIRSQKPSSDSLTQIPKIVEFVRNLIGSSDRIFKIVDTLKHIDDIFDTNPHVETDTNSNQHLQEEKIDLLIEKDTLLESIYKIPNNQDALTVMKNLSKNSHQENKINQIQSVSENSQKQNGEVSNAIEIECLNNSNGLEVIKEQSFIKIGQSYIMQNIQIKQEQVPQIQQKQQREQDSSRILIPPASDLIINDDFIKQSKVESQIQDIDCQQKQGSQNSFEEI